MKNTDTTGGSASGAAPGPAPERIPLDVGDELLTARLRLVSGLVAAPASVWLWLVSTAITARLVAFAGLFFSVLWALAYRRARLRTRSSAAHFLELGRHHFTLAEGARPRSVPWTEVRRVEIDGDRLQVVLVLPRGEQLAIEPRYGGLSLRALAERIDAARQAGSEGSGREVHASESWLQ